MPRGAGRGNAPVSVTRGPTDTILMSFSRLISGRWKSSSWSHEFEKLREDIWAGFVDTDTRVR
jgi:hypothetical protein